MRNQVLLTSLLGLLLSISASAAALDDPEREAFERGGHAYGRGDYRLAIEEYRQSLATFGPRYAEAHYNIGVCYYELGQVNNAVTWYRAAIKAKRDRYPAALFALGVALEDLREYEEARAAFKQAIAVSKGRHAGALFRFGLSLHREKDYEGAIESYRRALATKEGPFPACHNNLGVIMAMLGRLSEAEREFDIAVKQSKGRFDDAQHNLHLCRNLSIAKSQSLIAQGQDSGIGGQGQGAVTQWLVVSSQ